MRQIPLRLGPRPAPSFESYAVGDNAAALAALRAPRPAGVPIYLWGAPGAGKSHLLAALAREAEAQGTRVLACDAGRPAPWAWDEGAGPALLLLDGCEAYDAARQHAAFALCVEAATRGAVVAAAGRLPPVDLPVREDLRTRLGWGPVFQIVPLADDAVRATLQREAARRGIALGEEVLAYLLTRFARDLGSLMALLDALDEFALARQRPVTVPLLKEMLAEQATA